MPTERVLYHDYHLTEEKPPRLREVRKFAQWSYSHKRAKLGCKLSVLDSRAKVLKLRHFGLANPLLGVLAWALEDLALALDSAH